MAAKLFRKEFQNLPKNINWYPGHMRKFMNNMSDELKKISFFIEVRDARIPKTSENSELISSLPEQMKRIVVYNKIDLANEKKSIEIIKKISGDQEWLHTSTKDGVNINKLVKKLSDSCPVRFKTVGAWVMIGGMPNIGKSTLINSLRKRDSEIS
jgi:ribosome biogenesis GTPase A